MLSRGKTTFNIQYNDILRMNSLKLSRFVPATDIVIEKSGSIIVESQRELSTFKTVKTSHPRRPSSSLSRYVPAIEMCLWKQFVYGNVSMEMSMEKKEGSAHVLNCFMNN